LLNLLSLLKRHIKPYVFESRQKFSPNLNLKFFYIIAESDTADS
jgi:hypothetical protein